jgi:hydrogenase nickel incorporation protein HypA/HybF
MHELSLCQSLLRIIEKKMNELDHNAKRVTAIWLEMSLLCGVDVKSLEFYFPIVTKNTLAENARLHITLIAMPARCTVCQQDVSIEDFSPCPSCGNYQLIMAQKPELIVKRMEIH